MTDHPVELSVKDDLQRNRLTVFFRILLAIPHLIWVALWSLAVAVVVIVNWFVTLISGTPAKGLHGFLCAYVRYVTHLNSYLWLTANPYPGFVGAEDTYPIEVTLPPPLPQNRWKTFFRVALLVPALLISSTLGGGGASIRIPTRRGATYSGAISSGALALSAAFLGWFASLARGTMPKGLRDAGAYSVGYSAQMLAYGLLITDRYPNSDPTAMLAGVERPPRHTVRMVGNADDLRRSRVLVFFRLPLAVPHIVWLVLWGIVAFLAAVVNWFAALFTGTPAASLHRFLSRYVRYTLHVYAFLFLVGNPFPGFVGEEGTYPIDVELPGPQRQSRWSTGFRLLLAIPAFIVNSALGSCLYVAAFLTWFAALATGSAPWGLRNLSAYALRYSAQANAYFYLITDAYPHASPLEGAEPEEPVAEPPMEPPVEPPIEPPMEPDGA